MASSIDNIGEEILWEMRSTSTEYWTKLLAYSLNWRHVLEDEYEYFQESIVLDILRDHISFCLKSHFTLMATKKITQFVNSTLLTLPACDVSDVVLSLHRELENLLSANVASHQQLTCYTEFFVAIFLKHFQLIQFVMSCARERQKVDVDLHLNVPKRHKPLEGGEKILTWSYNERIRRIEAEETRRKKQRDLLKDAFIGEKNMMMECLKESHGDLSAEEDIEKWIKEVSNIHLEEITANMKICLDEFKDRINYNILKAQVPKPELDGDIVVGTSSKFSPNEDKPMKPKSRSVSAIKK